MVSPARAHFLRASAAALGAVAAAEAGAPAPNTSQYELMLAKLAEDRRRLKDVQSLERKAEVKREILPDYAPWVEGALKNAAGRQDDVLMTVMVWRIDIGDLAGALPIARYAIRHKLTLPDRFERNVATLVAEEFAEQSLKAVAAEQPVDIESLGQIGELTEPEDMPDEVRAKLHKAMGYAIRAEANATVEDDQRIDGLTIAKQHLQRALGLNGRVGVKKDIERLDTLLKNSAAAPKGSG